VTLWFVNNIFQLLYSICVLCLETSFSAVPHVSVRPTTNNRRSVPDLHVSLRSTITDVSYANVSDLSLEQRLYLVEGNFITLNMGAV
jgi:hypothetical protein